MSQSSAVDLNLGLYMSVMPMIKSRASHSDIDLDEFEAQVTKAFADVYVYEVHGDNLSSYEQAWKIDKLVWDKFFLPEEFPMPAPQRRPIEEAKDNAVKSPEAHGPREVDAERGSGRRSRAYDRGESRDRGSRRQGSGLPYYGPHGLQTGDSYRPKYDQPRGGDLDRHRSRSPMRDHQDRGRYQQSRPRVEVNQTTGYGWSRRRSHRSGRS